MNGNQWRLKNLHYALWYDMNPVKLCCVPIRRSLKIIHCCANQHGIYDFLLALHSNLASTFNCSWDITPSFHIHTPPLVHMELEKDGWEQMDMLWCQGAQNIGLSNDKLKSALKCTVWSQCTHLPNRWYWQTVKWSFKVTQGHLLLCQSTQHISLSNSIQ